MGHAGECCEAEDRLEQPGAIAAVPIDQGDSCRAAFVVEIDIWARRALAANGFGDY